MRYLCYRDGGLAGIAGLRNANSSAGVLYFCSDGPVFMTLGGHPGSQIYAIFHSREPTPANLNDVCFRGYGFDQWRQNSVITPRSIKTQCSSGLPNCCPWSVKIGRGGQISIGANKPWVGLRKPVRQLPVVVDGDQLREDLPKRRWPRHVEQVELENRKPCSRLPLEPYHLPLGDPVGKSICIEPTAAAGQSEQILLPMQLCGAYE